MKKYVRVKRNYNYLGDELRSFFGQKVYKISLNTGFSCPTRDGSKGFEGCFYCGSTGSHFVDTEELKPVKDQIKHGKYFLQKRYGVTKFLAYFQAFTSTYGDVSIFNSMCEDVLSDPDIAGFDVATRPDCINDEVLEVLVKFMKPRYHWLELGLESSHDTTLKSIGRGHTCSEFETAYRKVKSSGLRVCVHIILGLPDETEDMMIETVDRLVNSGVDGIKFHNLHIVKNSVFEREYYKGNIKLMNLQQYTELLGRILVRIPSSVVIHRLIGEAPSRYLVAPDWAGRKNEAVNFIEKYFEKNNIYQI
ncbi:MAG: TIGR01212 family radical SAM protein [bacterium]|nr:TIGR01212 family radical SAM protein [bacterium]